MIVTGREFWWVVANLMQAGSVVHAKFVDGKVLLQNDDLCKRVRELRQASNWRQ